MSDGVVRVGDTVRRPQGPHSALVHQALLHLEAVGFGGAPRFLGVDDQGREALSYVEGEVAGRPWPPWVADVERACRVAELVRRFDDAMVGLGLPREGVVPEPSPAGIPLPVGPAPTFLGHRDVTPENVVFRDGAAVALIDFDMLRPSSRVDEVCNLLLWWAPLMPPADREEVLRDVDPFDRAARIVAAYGLGEPDRVQVADVMLTTTERSWFLMRERARTTGGGWQRMWDEGVGDRITRRLTWLEDNRERLRSTMTQLG